MIINYLVLMHYIRQKINITYFTKKIFALSFFIFFGSICGYSEGLILLRDDVAMHAGSEFKVFSDIGSVYSENSIINAPSFKPVSRSIPIVYDPIGTVWFKLDIWNKTDKNDIAFYIQYFNIADFSIYKKNGDSLLNIYTSGYYNRAVLPRDYFPDYTGNLYLKSNEQATYFIRIKSKHPIVLPFQVGTLKAINNATDQHRFIIAFYIGILAAILFYNLFLYFSIRDRNYLLYCIYIFFLLFAQYSLLGYSFKYLWFNLPQINDYAVPVSSSIAGASATLFTIYFLRTNSYTPRIHKVFIASICISVIIILLSITGHNNLSYKLLDLNNMIVGLTALFTSIYIARQGYKPAYFYFISWLLFAIGIIVFSLRNLGVLPANDFTGYILYVGSGLETIFLSIALADKINLLQKEKEDTQKMAVEVSVENEKLVKQQNILLEEKVYKRTEELQHSNSQLNEAIINLKDTQTQLVESEKMASLGQLTAGIAHEINNPINFVKSNINPLKLDFADIITLLDKYDSLHDMPDENAIKQKLSDLKKLQKSLDIPFVKEEIKNLINGIEDGAERTAEIVRGLRTFTRIDESALKKVNIHDGINSTLVILKNSMPFHVEIVRNFNANGSIECFPGKLNQVFMNIFNNAFQSMIEISESDEKDFLFIQTDDIENDRIKISMRDTGIGMSEEVQKKVFEPFFTTKDVGEGTGLGLAIVHKIIHKHSGTIEVKSQVGYGTEFIIILPHDHVNNKSL